MRSRDETRGQYPGVRLGCIQGQIVKCIQGHVQTGKANLVYPWLHLQCDHPIEMSVPVVFQLISHDSLKSSLASGGTLHGVCVCMQIAPTHTDRTLVKLAAAQ